MTNHIILPRAVFESPNYLRLKISERQLLVELYAYYGECESFPLDWVKLTGNRSSLRPGIVMRMTRLAALNFLNVVGRESIDGRRRGRRIFRFVHSVAEAYG